MVSSALALVPVLSLFLLPSQALGFWTGWPFSNFQSILTDDVEIPGLGSVKGKYEESREGRQFVSFSGVPYGEKPERWLPAQPKTGWNDTLSCEEPGPICLQIDYLSMEAMGSEDCLFLNIHTPATSGKSLPVLVFFHGGGLAMGASQYYQPHFLMDQEVILVTVNYRLDILGFFSLDTPKVSGNQGLRDAQLALLWMKTNIEHFGGDPSRVTISGQSGGSWLVSMLYVSPLSEGLFSGAIAQSGVMIGDVGYNYDTREESSVKSQQLASALGCTGETPDKVEACLRDIPAEFIMKVGWETQVSWIITRGVLDPQSAHGSVLPYPMEEVLSFGLFQQVPLMIGTSSQEGLSFVPEVFDPSMIEEHNQDWSEFGTRLIFADRSEYNNGSDFGPCDRDIAMRAKESYFGDSLTSDDLVPYLNLTSDTKFGYPTYKYIGFVSDKVPVYNYQLTFQTNSSFSFAVGTVGMGLGTTHGDELPYLFVVTPEAAGGLNVTYSDWSDSEVQFSKLMCQLWVNFAKTGSPTTAEDEVKWPAYTLGNKQKMSLDLPLTMMVDQEELERFSKWDEILEGYDDC